MQLIKMLKLVLCLLFSVWSQKAFGLVSLQTSSNEDTSLYLREYSIWKASSTKTSNLEIAELYKWYKEGRNWDMAIKTLARLKFMPGDSLDIEARAQKSLIYFLSGNYDWALREALSLENLSLKQNQMKFIYGILICSLIEKEDFRVSQFKLKRYIDSDTVSNSKKIALFNDYKRKVDEISKMPFKSVTKARTLSTFLPSSGIFYSGNVSKGFVNLGLQLSAALYLTANILFQNYFTAATFNFQLCRQFYSGGVNQTGPLVQKYNHDLLIEPTLQLKQTAFEILDL